MPLISDTFLTSKGFEIANKAANGQTSFTITKVVSSPENISSKSKDEIRKLNNLNNEINSGQIINTDVRSSNLTGIVTQFGNDIYSSGYEVGATGLYAKETNSDNEFLYAVTPMEQNEQVPAIDSNVFSGLQITIYVIAGDSQRMDVSLSKGGDASIDLVEKLISNSEDEIGKRIDSLNLGKADKSDLQELQNNVGGDLQNRLTSLNNGKQDKEDSTQKFGYLNTIKANTDDMNAKDIQTFNSANSYTDQKYNELDNKNNILSSKVEDYQKPNLVDISTDEWTTQSPFPGLTILKANVYFEAGKQYCLSIEYDHDDWNDADSSINVYPDYIGMDIWGLGWNYRWKTNLKPTYKFTPNKTGNTTLTFMLWGSPATGGNHYLAYRHLTITQTSDFIPYEIAERNRKAIISASQTDLDNAKSDFSNKTDILSQKINDSHTDLNLAKADKYNSYTKDDVDTRIAWAKAELNNNKQDKSDSTKKFDWLNSVKANTVDKDNDIQIAFNNANTYTNQQINASKPEQSTMQNGWNLTGFTWDIDMQINGINTYTLGGADGVPKSVSFYGDFHARRQNNEVKQYIDDNLGNRYYRVITGFNQNQPFKKVATEDDLASITQNAWRELTPINGATGTVLCKPDFTNNRALIIYDKFNVSRIRFGTPYLRNDANDFNFVTQPRSDSAYPIGQGNELNSSAPYYLMGYNMGGPNIYSGDYIPIQPK